MLPCYSGTQSTSLRAQNFQKLHKISTSKHHKKIMHWTKHERNLEGEVQMVCCQEKKQLVPMH